jgi:Anti-sigma-K factor rskA
MTQDPEDQRVLDALGRAVPQVAPPPGLRAKVLAAAVREPIEPAGAPAAVPATSAPVPFPSRPAPVSAAAPASLWPWLVAAASMALAVGASLGWISARGEVARLQSTIAELRASAAEFLNVRAEFDRERSDRERVIAILSAGDVHSASLGSVAPAGAARGHVYVSASRGLFFAAESLPPLPAGRTYQLWTIVAGQPVSHGIFEPEGDGRAQVLAQAPPGAVQAIAVTIEPDGGVPAPTGDKVLLGLPAAN